MILGAIDLTDANVLQIFATVFAAGVLYQKVSSLEKKVDSLSDHGERITAVETEIENIKEKQ